MSFFLIRNFTFKAVLVMVSCSLLLVKSQEEYDTKLENMLTTLVSPNEQPTIQLQALRNELIRRIKEIQQREEFENELLQYKRSLSSLARWNNMPDKRNLESLARAGYIRTLPVADESGYKRSFLMAPADSQYFLTERPMYKRNVASLARSGMKVNGKRNAAVLLRQDSYLNSLRSGRDENQTQKPADDFDMKRNLASIKAQYKPKFKRSTSRSKREADYYDMINDEYSLPVYQSLFDYDDEKDLGEEYPNPGKRFLGSVARSGWFRQPSRFVPPSKRHIGSLARLGWLPSFRTARRFNRSGRSTNSCDNRSSTNDIQIYDDTAPEDPLQLNGKRFLVQPAVDKILLEKVYMQPRPE